MNFYFMTVLNATPEQLAADLVRKFKVDHSDAIDFAQKWIDKNTSVERRED